MAMAEPAMRAPLGVGGGLEAAQREGQGVVLGTPEQHQGFMKLFQDAMKVVSPRVPSAEASSAAGDAPVDADLALQPSGRAASSIPWGRWR